MKNLADSELASIAGGDDGLLPTPLHSYETYLTMLLALLAPRWSVQVSD